MIILISFFVAGLAVVIALAIAAAASSSYSSGIGAELPLRREVPTRSPESMPGRQRNEASATVALTPAITPSLIFAAGLQ